MDEMYKSVHAQYENYQIEQEIKDIENFEKKLNTGTGKKKRNKKGKKKNKDTKNPDSDKISKGSSE